GFSLSGSGVD
uniref:Sperm-activating peptide (Ser-3,5,7, Asp-10 speract) n=1 Tax=Hemicentrotus pulcherrimus TaxID=7650 RepID=Q7M4C9_HEMPU